jgi:hypothetical protein
MDFVRAMERLPHRALVLGAVSLAGLVCLVAAASADHRRVNFYDARYCEIFVLRGTVPDARVSVFNTIGLGHCPASKWNAIDPAKLAEHLHATGVVLNGPRHFLMDSASGHLGDPRWMAGMRVRKAASIDIKSPADLVQTPYTERTIHRHNTWRWDHGRRVYELVAPNGSRYVMQSYSLIKDPDLSIPDLRTLGPRLELPTGWRYRTKRLRQDLTVRANGRATIVQDDLLDTYQRIR